MMKKLLLLLFVAGYGTLNAQNFVLWDGETPNINTCQFDYAQANSKDAYQGSWCFQGNPDPWHSPGILLTCQNTWRSDISNYDEIWFYTKANKLGQSFIFSLLDGLIRVIKLFGLPI